MDHTTNDQTSLPKEGEEQATSIVSTEPARVAFKMKLFPGSEAEYKKRHDEIWPELQALLKDSGISEYSIFLDPETASLFGVLKADDLQKLDALPQHDVMQRWWRSMADVMETNPDFSPRSVPLNEVFYLP